MGRLCRRGTTDAFKEARVVMEALGKARARGKS